MQSTGEVIGIHEDPRVALAKALGRRAGPASSRRGSSRGHGAGGAGALALLSIADRDKAELPRLAAALGRAGYPARGDAGHASGDPGGRASRPIPVAKLGAEPDPATGEAAILDLITSGDVRLVVNTPTPRSGAVRDAAEIRHAAIAEGVPCLTAIETAVAAAEALDPEIAERLADVRSLAEWVPSPGTPPPPAPAEPEAVAAGASA